MKKIYLGFIAAILMICSIPLILFSLLCSLLIWDLKPCYLIANDIFDGAFTKFIDNDK